MRPKLILLFAIAATFFLFACAPAQNNVTPTSIGKSPAPTNAPSLATAVPFGDDVLVIYHKSGGIAGIAETLVVHQGGLLEWTMRGGATKSLQVDHALLQPLRRMLEQKDFGELETLYQATGADLFTYTITARDTNGNPKTVTTMDGAKTPPYLGQLLVMLEQLRAGMAKNG